MNRQYFFDSENIKLIFLSPYVDAAINDKNHELILYRVDTYEKVNISADNNEALKHIYKNLQDGISRENLSELLGAEKAVNYLLSKGIIE